MTDDDLRHAHVLRRLGDWEGVIRLYQQSYIRDHDQPHTGLFDDTQEIIQAYARWNQQNPGVRDRITQRF